MHRNRSVVAAAIAAAALAVPAVAGAHPGIYNVKAKLARAPEVQTITVDATGGTFKPSAAAAAVAFDAPSYVVEAALAQDPAIGADLTGTANVLVTGPVSGVYKLTYQGTKATANVAQVAPDATGLTGGAASATAVTVTEGGSANIVYPADPATMVDQDQYLIANDGFVLAYRETNGLTAAGMLNLKLFPSAYRAPFTGVTPAFPMTDWVSFPFTQSNVQPHATCRGVAALSDPANVIQWQNDPFYNYIPWQKTPAAFQGLGDNHAGKGGPTGVGGWIELVKSVTNGLAGAPAGGVDLTALSTVTDFATACSSIGGTYVPADITTDPAGTEVSEAVTAASDPLNAQITTLTADKTTLQSQVTALTADKAALQADKTALQHDKAALQQQVNGLGSDKAALQAKVTALTNRPLTLTLASSRFTAGKGVVMVTGKAGASVQTRILVSQSEATRLHLSSRVVSSSTKRLGAQGSLLVTPGVSASVRSKLGKRSSSSRVTVEVTAGGATVTRSATLL